MPIPQVHKQQTFEGTIAINRQAVRLDASLTDAREGIYTMLNLGEENSSDTGAQIEGGGFQL